MGVGGHMIQLQDCCCPPEDEDRPRVPPLREDGVALMDPNQLAAVMELKGGDGSVIDTR